MYKVTTKALHERHELIEQAVQNSTENFAFYEYQNTKNDLPVIRLEIDIPIYRLSNYRTRTAQLRYLHDHEKPSDFFIAGQENESVQQAQHNILLVFAKQGRAVSVSPIFEELEREGQREPILITGAGVVVNGNRRLAAMRELFTEKPSEFSSFSHVDCMVLPGNVTEAETREIEVRLQMQPETKLPYGWVEESIAIQELLQSSKSSEHIASLMKKSKKKVERAARALTEADLYLKDWLTQPGEYQLVEGAEQLFTNLAEALENREGEQVEISRRIAWALLSNSKQLTGRIYNYNFSFDSRSEEVIDALSERLGVELTKESSDSNDNSDLEIDFSEDSDTSLMPLIDAFDDLTQRQHIAEELIATCDSILEQDKQSDIGRRALASIQSANNKLQEADLTKADPGTYSLIQTQLTSVIQRANVLSVKLQSYLSGETPSKNTK